MNGRVFVCPLVALLAFSPVATSHGDFQPDELVGRYQCISVTEVGGRPQPCETSEPIELNEDMSWFWGTDVGNWTLAHGYVLFSSPYSSGNAGWGGGGPADWGPAEVEYDASMVFRPDDVVVVWKRDEPIERSGQSSSANSPVPGVALAIVALAVAIPWFPRRG